MEKKEKSDSEAAYLADLKKFNKERGAYAPFSEASNDIPAIRKIKTRINSIIEKELVLQDFKDQLDKEALSKEAFKEVVTKKSFYF